MSTLATWLLRTVTTPSQNLLVWSAAPAFLLVLCLFPVGDWQYSLGLVLSRLPVMAFGVWVICSRKQHSSTFVMMLFGTEVVFYCGRILSIFLGTGNLIVLTFWVAGYVMLVIGAYTLSCHWANGDKLVLFQDTALICLAWVMVSADMFGVRYFTSVFDDGLPWATRLTQVLSSSYQFFDVLALGMCIRTALMMLTKDRRAMWLLIAVSALAIGDLLWQMPAVYLATGNITLVSDALYQLHVMAMVFLIAMPQVDHESRIVVRSQSVQQQYREGVLLTLCLAIPSLFVLIVGMSDAHQNSPVALYGGAGLALVAAWRVHTLLRKTSTDAEDFLVRATHDGLTGCLNRAGWDATLRLVGNQTSSQYNYHIIFLDLDHFKRYNDTHGHQAGDDLLIAAVSTWQSQLPDDCILARVGGEEFAVLVPLMAAEQADAIAESLLSCLPEGVTCSAGIASGVVRDDPAVIVQRADKALYRAKADGRNRCERYSNAWAQKHMIPRQSRVGSWSVSTSDR